MNIPQSLASTSSSSIRKRKPETDENDDPCPTAQQIKRSKTNLAASNAVAAVQVNVVNVQPPLGSLGGDRRLNVSSFNTPLPPSPPVSLAVAGPPLAASPPLPLLNMPSATQSRASSYSSDFRRSSTPFYRTFSDVKDLLVDIDFHHHGGNLVDLTEAFYNRGIRNIDDAYWVSNDVLVELGVPEWIINIFVEHRDQLWEMQKHGAVSQVRCH